MRRIILTIILLATCLYVPNIAGIEAQQAKGPEAIYVLRPAAVFDGESAELHRGWVVLVRGEKIEATGPPGQVKSPADAKTIELPGLTLMPGLIEAHSHVLLHPYSETSWNDQVAREALWHLDERHVDRHRDHGHLGRP